MAAGQHDDLYWNSYYRHDSVPELPSQFALFVANEIATGELPVPSAIIDVGCGNGRDTLLFAQLGYTVCGIDMSEAAITICQARMGQASLGAGLLPRFCIGTVDGDEIGAFAEEFDGPLLIYSRFLMHAIDAETEGRAIVRIAAVLARYGGVLAAEFRTPGDEQGQKVTSPHFRRFVDPDRFVGRLQAVGMSVIWRAEGHGMAKFRKDNAYVARVLARA